MKKAIRATVLAIVAYVLLLGLLEGAQVMSTDWIGLWAAVSAQ